MSISAIRDIVFQDGLALESGARLPELHVRLRVFGGINSQKRIVWICHALTADSDPSLWWKDLFESNELFNLDTYTVICLNNLGSCYGTSGPESICSNLNMPYHLSFPEFTIRDMALVQRMVAKFLNIRRIDFLLGASMGGQIALEWAIEEPKSIENLILIATNAKHSPWGIAFNEAQRMALKADGQFGEGGAARKGLQAARAMAQLSYRSYQTYQNSQEDGDELEGIPKAASYQNYQGQKLAKRFSAYSYWYLSKAMDSHNVARNRGGLKQALNSVLANTLVIGISSDLLFPIQEQEFLAENIPEADFQKIESDYGHDGFLTEIESISKCIEEFLSVKEAFKNEQ